MKYALVLAIYLGACAVARAERYLVDGKEITKLEAMYTVATQPQKVVEKCVQQEINEKGTGIRGKKTKKK